jgi:hypothetical protein
VVGKETTKYLLTEDCIAASFNILLAQTTILLSQLIQMFGIYESLPLENSTLCIIIIIIIFSYFDWVGH